MLFSVIKELCNKKGISISRLEKECKIGNGTISGWRTASPSVENLKKVADYFGIGIDGLLEARNDKIT